MTGLAADRTRVGVFSFNSTGVGGGTRRSKWSFGSRLGGLKAGNEPSDGTLEQPSGPSKSCRPERRADPLGSHRGGEALKSDSP